MVQALIAEERTVVIDPLTANDQVPPKNASTGALVRAVVSRPRLSLNVR
jgi:hypothetical protein